MWINETTDYCKAVTEIQINFISTALKLYQSIDPAMIQTCPVSGKWGANNVTVDHSVLDKFPINILPTKSVRSYLTAYSEDFDVIGTIIMASEIKIKQI